MCWSIFCPRSLIFPSSLSRVSDQGNAGKAASAAENLPAAAPLMQNMSGLKNRKQAEDTKQDHQSSVRLKPHLESKTETNAVTCIM